MKSNRNTALAYILQDEGSEFNVSSGEPGGASKYGVSVVALSDWNKRHGLPFATIADVGNMTADLASQIYGADYLDPIRFDDLPSGIDYRLADIVINLGLTGGITTLQLALGMWPITGIVDTATLAMLKGDSRAIVLSLSAAWIATKHASLNWNPSPITKNGYGHGWSNRNIAATARALAMIGK